MNKNELTWCYNLMKEIDRLIEKNTQKIEPKKKDPVKGFSDNNRLSVTWRNSRKN